MPRLSRRLPTAVAGLVLSGLAALPAVAGGCAYSTFGCGLDHDETSAQPVRAHTVAAVLPVLATEPAAQVYEALLPDRFDVPARPLVAVQLTTFGTGACSRPAGAPAIDCPALEGWTEGVVALRTAVDGVDGWFVLSRPVTTGTAFAASRAAGLPAYLAVGAVVTEAQGAIGRVTVAGERSLEIGWRPQSGGIVDAALVELVQGRTAAYGVTPLFTGSDRHRTSRAVRPAVPVFDLLGGAPNSAAAVPGVTSTAAAQRGAVTVSIDPDLSRLDDLSPESLPEAPLPEGTSLADLVELDQTVTGLRWLVDGLLLSQTDALDDRRDGPLPAPPALTSGILATPGAQTTGFATRVSSMTRGSSLTFTNLDATQHDVLSLESGPDGRPLFASEVVGQGTTTKVVGAELLPAGQYRWVCSLHAGMTGELVVG